jgi:hypothetical protein
LMVTGVILLTRDTNSSPVRVSSLVEVVGQPVTQSSVGDVHPCDPGTVDEDLAASAEVALSTHVAYSADLA